MRFTGNRDQRCGKCKKTTRFVRCPKCEGKGGSWSTQCHHCGSTGYKCEKGIHDRYHA